MLVAKLDRMLPDDARRGGFKGAGPRSAGVWGRSFFNVLSDTIEHLKGLGPRSATEAPMSLPAMGLSYFDGDFLFRVALPHVAAPHCPHSRSHATHMYLRVLSCH